MTLSRTNLHQQFDKFKYVNKQLSDFKTSYKYWNSFSEAKRNVDGILIFDVEIKLGNLLMKIFWNTFSDDVS